MQTDYTTISNQNVTMHMDQSGTTAEPKTRDKSPALIIINRKGEIQRVNLSDYDKNALFLGREGRDIDIRIQDEIVSKTHGYIVQKKGSYFYKDLDSTNGTYVDFAKKREFLHHNDKFVELFDGSILRIGSTKNRDNLVLIWFTYLDEGEALERHVVSHGPIRIGRSGECEIRLKHPSVSRVHGTIEADGDRWVLRDNKSLNGILVNGAPITKSHPLQDKDAIQVSGHQLIYAGKYIYYKSELSGISIRTRHVNKWVGKSTARKQILKDVEIDIKGNEFVAIIGGSGAGKTTLMNVINGFDRKFRGEVYCNNISLTEHFQHIKSIIGYVPQEDIVHENITLRKMLYYTAKLKMPEDTDRAEIEARIDEVLQAIGLEAHQNTYIRKLSGGQKKRASIAVELLGDPKLFFLDEPTSGLDPGTEKNLMMTLRDLAKKQGRTIILVTHTTQNLDLCDKVIFMGRGGQVGFVGSVPDALKFFDTRDLTNVYGMLDQEPERWNRKYREERGLAPEEPKDAQAPAFDKRRASAFRQFTILTKRYTELIRNDLKQVGMLFAMPLAIGLLITVVAADDTFEIYESTKSMMFALSCAGIWMGLFNSIQEICKERSILKREYMANLKLPVYILSKVLVQGVIGCIQALLMGGIFLIFIKTQEPGILFEKADIEILMTMAITIIASESMGFAISSVVKSGDKAMQIAPILLILQLLFSGILFELKGLGECISYVTVSRWSVEALGSTANLNGLDLRLQEEFPMLEHEAESLFDAEKLHLLQDWGILLVMTVVCIAVSVVLLRSVAKDGR